MYIIAFVVIGIAIIAVGFLIAYAVVRIQYELKFGKTDAIRKWQREGNHVESDTKSN